jgi:hypothetical protein
MQRLNLQGTILKVKSIGWRFTTKNELKRERARDLKNQDASQGSKARSNSRIQFASNRSKFVPPNFGPWTPI